jgi:tetratricopeptide (TPR) repeat protein
MTLDEAINHQDGAALVSFLGIGENIKVDGNTHSSKLKVDDVLLICTDGLYNPLTEAELIESLQNSDAMKAAKDLQHKTLDKQFLTQDNLTGVVLRIQTDKNKKSCMRSIVKLALVCFTLLTLMFLGYFLYKNLHLPVLKNQETKLQVLEQVIEVKPLSVIEQQLELANKFYEAKNFKEAIGLFKLLVEQGNARAQYKLGEMLDKGLGVKKDQKQAYIYYKKAADQGEKDAIKALKGKVDDSKNIKNNEPVKGVAQTDTNKVSKDIEPTKTKEK